MAKPTRIRREKPTSSDRLRERLRRRFQGLLRRVPVDADGVARVKARQIYILPTGAGIFYAAVVMAMILGSLNFQNNLGLLFGFFLAGVGLIAMHRCWFNLLGLGIQTRPGSAVFAGATAAFAIGLRNERSSPRFDLHAVGAASGLAGLHLEPCEQREQTLSLPSDRRGLLRLDEVEIETRHPMHLFRAWCYAQSTAACIVYPRPADRAPATDRESGEAHAHRSARGEGSDDFLGPREYRLGDPPRRLDWKAFARERGLVVKQFGAEQGGALWIDWSGLSERDAERRIALLTRQVLDAAESGQRFGLRLPGIRVPLDRGMWQAVRCLSELALFDPPHAPPDTHRASA